MTHTYLDVRLERPGVLIVTDEEERLVTDSEGARLIVACTCPLSDDQIFEEIEIPAKGSSIDCDAPLSRGVAHMYARPPPRPPPPLPDRAHAPKPGGAASRGLPVSFVFFHRCPCRTPPLLR